jgi:hypothetical protein
MANVPAHTRIFSRGSTVLDYWLAHAEGLTIQPLGARVEHVVVSAPVGRAEALIVRSRMTRRRRSIPVESIAAVEPSTGHLLLDTAEVAAGPRVPRPSPELIAAARAGAARGGRVARTGAAGAARSTRAGTQSAVVWLRPRAAGAARSTQAGTLSALTWLRPRAAHVGATTARQTRFAAAQTVEGIFWLAPRIGTAARKTGTAFVQLTLFTAVIVGRAAVRTARELERAGPPSAALARASVEARRARQRPRD